MTLFHQGDPEHVTSIRLLEQAETKGIGYQAITTHLEDTTLRMSRLCLFNSRSSFHLFLCLRTAAVTDQSPSCLPILHSNGTLHLEAYSETENSALLIM